MRHPRGHHHIGHVCRAQPRLERDSGGAGSERQIYARRTHFVLLEIYDGHIRLQAISVEGELIDQVRIDLR